MFRIFETLAGAAAPEAPGADPGPRSRPGAAQDSPRRAKRPRGTPGVAQGAPSQLPLSRYRIPRQNFSAPPFLRKVNDVNYIEKSASYLYALWWA